MKWWVWATIWTAVMFITEWILRKTRYKKGILWRFVRAGARIAYFIAVTVPTKR